MGEQKLELPTLEQPAATKPDKLAIQPAVFEKEPTFEFMSHKPGAEFDILSLKEDERDFDLALAKYNRGVIDAVPTVGNVPGAEDYLKHTKFGYKALESRPDLIKNLEDKGKIGVGETWERMNKWGLIPYLGDVVEIGEDVAIFSLVKKADAGMTLTPEEDAKLQEFAWDMIEIDVRGQTMGGKFIEGAYKMPAFAIEFMTGGKILKTFGKNTIGKALKKSIAKGSRRYIKGRIGKGMLKMSLEGTGRAILSPIAWRKRFVERKLNDSITVTDKGEVFFKEGQEAPASTLIRSFGDVWVEQASETAGSYLFKPLGRNVRNALPKGLKKSFDKFVRAEKGMSSRKAMSKWGFDGMIEEIGEERLGDFLRVTLDLDPEEGYSLDQYGSAMFPNWEDLLVEAGVIGVHGAVSRAGIGLVNRLAGKERVSTKEGMQKIMDDVDHLTEIQKQTLLDEVVSRETLEDTKLFDTRMESYKEMLVRESGQTEKEADANMAIFDAMVTTIAGEHGMTRAEAFDKFAPTITSQETGGLKQDQKGAYDPSLDTISLLKTSDQSTFVHEISHTYLQFQLKAGAKSLDPVFEWAKIIKKPLNELSDQEFTRLQERFARGFEAYIMEGKAPNSKLAEVFESFKNWLLNIYDNVGEMSRQAGFEIELSDDIRGFYNTMLDVEAERDIVIDKDVAPELDIDRGPLFQDARKKIANLEKRVREIKDKFTSLKGVQQEITNIIKGLPLEAKDKAKFLSSIKEVKTEAQLTRVQGKVLERGRKLYEQEQKRIIDKAIKKELKTTKPQKKGAKVVGRYQYADNLMFKDLREYDKYNQEQAISAINNFEMKEIMDESDLLKIKYLEYKANGMKGSVELHSQVLDGITRAKELAVEVDSDVMFEKKFNRQQMKDDAIAAMKGTKELKQDTVKGKLVQKYVGSIANIKSMLHAIGGEKLANMFKMGAAVGEKFTKTYMTKEGMREKGMEIYDVDSEYQFNEVLDGLNELNYDIIDKRFEDSDKISKQTIMTMYNWNKNAKTSELMVEQFGQEQLDGLFAMLSEQDKTFADSIMETVQSYGDELNRKHIEGTGVDQGRIENYFPRTSEYMQDLNADIRMQGETPTSARARAKGKVFLKPTPIMNLAMRHIDQAEHTIEVTDTWKDMRRTFDDPMVKREVIKKIGEAGYNAAIDLINENSLNKEVARIDEITSTFNKAVGNWVVSKIALNPTVFVKQLGSMSNYAENMPAGEWALGMGKSLLNAKATMDYMFENSKYLRARYGSGHSEALMAAIKNAQAMAKKQVWTKGLASLVRMGDIGAIIYGGHSYVMYLQTEAGGNLSKEAAFKKFVEATKESQQSGLSSDIGLMQARSKGVMKMFTAFKNTSMQYTRKMVDATMAYENGEITAQQYAKIMSIYLLIQPMIYGMAGAAMKSLFMLGLEDDEEVQDRFFDYTMKALLTAPTNAIPIISDIHKTVVDMAMATAKGEKYNVYGRQMFSLPVLGDAEKAIKATYKLMGDVSEGDDITVFDIIDSFGIYTEIGVGSPAGQWSRIVKNRLKKKKKSKRTAL